MKHVTDLKLTVWERLRCKLSSHSRPTVLRNGTSRACVFLRLRTMIHVWSNSVTTFGQNFYRRRSKFQIFTRLASIRATRNPLIAREIKFLQPIYVPLLSTIESFPNLLYIPTLSGIANKIKLKVIRVTFFFLKNLFTVRCENAKYFWHSIIGKQRNFVR